MSLINEALKKAQPERGGPPSAPPPVNPGMPQTPPPHSPRRRRSYLWGFLMAVIIVGLFSALVTTYLVHQILGDESGQTAKAEPAQVEPAQENSGQVWEKLPDTETAVAADAQAAPAETEVAGTGPQTQAKPELATAAPEPAPEEEQATPPPPPAKPNPAVWARLQELEIRGIMSGGEKVLIFDTSTGKTKSYKPGDILDGSLALSISSIETDAILFEDYGGIIHTKPF